MPWVQDELPLVLTSSADTPDCPDCVQGKHGNCDGLSWDNLRDELSDCPCALLGH